MFMNICKDLCLYENLMGNISIQSICTVAIFQQMSESNRSRGVLQAEADGAGQTPVCS